MIKREKRHKKKLNTISAKPKAIDWLKPALRSSIHEFNQAITAFGFTASSLSLLAWQIEQRKANEIKRELIELSEQMKEAELRYKRSVQVLDYFTTSEMRAEKISLPKAFEAVNELFQTYLRKQKIQISFGVKKEIIVECLPEKIYRMWAFLLIAVTEQRIQEVPNDTGNTKVKIEARVVQKDVIFRVKGQPLGVAFGLFKQLLKDFEILGKESSKDEVTVDGGHCKLRFIFSK